MAFDADNQAVEAVRTRAAKAVTDKARRQQEKAERSREEQTEKKRLATAFKVRNCQASDATANELTRSQERHLFWMASPRGTQANPFSPHFDTEDATKSTLVFPVFFLYPQHATSDTISDFVEDTTFSAHLSQMFPPGAPKPDWDRDGEYTARDLVVYAITHRRRLLKVGKRMTLADVFEAAKKPGDGLELEGGCLTFVVLPKGDVEQNWVDRFKE